MKQVIKFSFLLLILGVSFTGCLKQEDPVFSSPTQIEFDLATFQARTSGYPFPIATRVPQSFGRAIYASSPQSGGTAADPALSRTWLTGNPAAATQRDTVYMRVNLVGPQRSAPEVFTCSVNSTYTTGIEGTHFELVDKTFTIPANSNFGIVRWRVLNPGAPAIAGFSAQVVFDLGGNSNVSVNPNYKTLGWLISQ